MFKRVMMVGLLGLGLAITQSGEIQGHGLPVSGSWYPCCSVTVDSVFKGISNPTTNPGETTFSVEVQEYELLCYNPADNTASATVMVRGPVTIVETVSNSLGSWTKSQGRLKQNAHLETSGILPANFTCSTGTGGAKDNWIPKPETILVTKFKGTITAYSCTDLSCSVTQQIGQLVQSCDVEGTGFSAANPPVESDVLGAECPGVGCKYHCETDALTHFSTK